MLRNLVLALCLTLALRADVTVRYKNDYKLAPFLPPSMIEQSLEPLKMAMPPSAAVQIKGSRGYSNYGKISSIVDFDKQEITLVDAANKTFATLPIQDYASKMEAAMPKMPLDAGPMKSMKSNVTSRKTGRIEVIQGIRAEESELTLSMDLLETMGPLAAGPFMKMVMHAWTVQPDEALRVPAVREWAGFNAYTNYLMDPLAVMQKILTRMPGMGEGLASLTEQRPKAPMLKSHVEMYMPFMAQILQHAGPAGTAPSQFDPNVPILETNSEMVELSTVPIDDSVFQVSGEFQSASVEELMRTLTGQSMMRQTHSAPPTPANEQSIKQIRVNGNVQAANLIQKVEPVYPPLARQARIQGAVRFAVTIDKDGHVENADLVSGHPLLISAAKEAILQWTYKPTLLNGQPIAVVTQAEVSFSLP